MSQKMSRKPRRGVTLIFVISMIVLFMLLGTTFALVSASYYRGAQKTAKKEIYRDPPQVTLDRVLTNLVIGPKDTNSPLFGVDIASDKYGYGGLKIAATGAALLPPSGNQFLVITTGNTGQLNVDSSSTPTLSPFAGAYNGQELTFIDGPASGVTCRIIGYSIPDSASRQFYIMIDNHDLNAKKFFADVVPVTPHPGLDGSTFILNPRPFAGKGAGALVAGPIGPNTAAFVGITDPNSPLRIYRAGDPDGFTSPYYTYGPGESFDVPDYRDPWLSADIPMTGGEYFRIPSWHRPALLHYAFNQGYTTEADLRPFFMGPMGDQVNAEFPGINVPYAAANPLESVAQVDTDNDYVLDSIWIDPGFPVQTDESGRNFKVLFAAKIVDLDGRININVAGTNYPTDYTTSLTATDLLAKDNTTISTSAFTRRGMGVGPAEINIDSVVATGELSAFMEARYGTDAVPGVAGVDSLLTKRLYSYPTAGNFMGNAAGSYLDIKGRTAVGIDLNGNPRFDVSNLSDGYTDHPYEMNLLQKQSADSTFSIAEMERFLRPYDIDSTTLPNRLTDKVARLKDESDPAIARTRKSVTTRSFDVTVPNDDIAKYLAEILDLTDKAVLDPTSTYSTKPEAVSAQRSGMLGRDVLMGHKMNINWPFGNGIDDNANGVVDEPSEAPTELLGGVVFDHDLDGANDAGDAFARYHFARKLYVLTLLTNQNLALDLDGDDVPTVIEARKIIAQWVANVVDFRDTDSIMTGFEFDLNPFDGWHVDGNLTTDDSAAPAFSGSPSRFVAWGCERPELLFSEVSGLHVRGTQDLAVGETTDAVAPATPDDDFDQAFHPQSTVIIELSNPWGDSTLSPQELYTGAGVDLKKLTPDGGTPGAESPIWRMLVVKGDGIDQDPDTTDVLVADRERSIYFCLNANLPVDDHGETYIPDATFQPNIGLIGPHQHAVIATAGVEAAGVYTRPLGYRTDQDHTVIPRTLGANTRRFELEPTANRFSIIQPDATTPTTFNTLTRTCTVIPIPNLNFSIPVGGYPDGSGGIHDPAVAYTPAIEKPFDRDRADDLDHQFHINGTIARFREIHLQRLANPLQPFHAITNPYRTIDSMDVDLTTCNGVAKTAADATESSVSTWLTDSTTDFSSVERGQHEVESVPQVLANLSRQLWKHEPPSVIDATATPAISGDEHVFNYNIKETFGTTNLAYDLTDPRFTGEKVAFPWLTWNNRPFISQLELMMVPKSSSSRLLHDFSMGHNANSYTALPATPPSFGHLLNFFQSSTGNVAGSDLHRIFDYTHVPSLFAGTQHLLNENDFSGLTEATGINGFNAPYNYISAYRVPGKVNLNTMYQRQVYEALHRKTETTQVSHTGGFDGPSWKLFNESRAGRTSGLLANSAATFTGIDPTLPTIFANPFRTASEANMVPELASPASLVRPQSETGLLRSSAADLADVVAGRSPLFDTAKADADQEAYDNDDRNAFFRYESIQRLENLTTTRSNVFAIWITIGYFEVDQQGRLGKELGSDTGKSKRHRMFSVVDRSIPFAFEPGKNHNIDKIILSKRYIE